MLAWFLHKYDPKRAIFISFTNFFSELQYYSISCKYYINQQKKSMVGERVISPDLASSQENRMMNIKNFHGAVQSNNTIFAGFKHVKI